MTASRWNGWSSYRHTAAWVERPADTQRRLGSAAASGPPATLGCGPPCPHQPHASRLTPRTPPQGKRTSRASRPPRDHKVTACVAPIGSSFVVWPPGAMRALLRASEAFHALGLPVQAGPAGMRPQHTRLQPQYARLQPHHARLQPSVCVRGGIPVSGGVPPSRARGRRPTAALRETRVPCVPCVPYLREAR